MGEKIFYPRVKSQKSLSGVQEKIFYPRVKSQVFLSGVQENMDKIISIHHECEGGIEKSIPRITDWHHEACRVMTNGDREGRIFLSHIPTHTRSSDPYVSLLLENRIHHWCSVGTEISQP